MEVAKEYQAQGKLRWIGFSTHGMTPIIVKTIESDAFDYVNLHFHFIGSYTSSGSGFDGSNWVAVKAAARHDMGVFIISPNDKGGMLYKPPQKLADATAPLSPIAFNNLWLLSYPQLHTMVIGAARPSDFDEHIASLSRYSDDPEQRRENHELTDSIATRLRAMMRAGTVVRPATHSRRLQPCRRPDTRCSAVGTHGRRGLAGHGAAR